MEPVWHGLSRIAGGGGHLARRPLATALACLVLVLGWAVPGAALEEYLLGPQDRVRLKIYEWRASRDVIFEWTALNDEFTVGADGQLFLPFVGEVPAAGLRPADLAGTIRGRLVQNMGLGRPPDVAVEVVEFRPFYIVGEVTQPGAYPYRPGLTVLQALSLAGGLRKRLDDASRIDRELIAGRGDLGLLAQSRLNLLARKARLEAELEDADEVRFPAQLADRGNAAAVALMMDQERTIFAARREGLETQVQALDELRAFLQKEIAALETQLSFQDRQIEILTKELAGVSTLVEQGLAVAPREMALQRSLIDLQSGRLSAETALLRARQETSRTEIAILDLRNRHVNEVAAALRETEAQLAEAEARADTTLRLLYESEMVVPRLRARESEAQPRYTIVRAAPGGAVEAVAAETTPVQPGDTIKVEVEIPDLSELQPASAMVPAALDMGAAAGAEAPRAP